MAGHLERIEVESEDCILHELESFDYPVPEASVFSHTECGFRCRVEETQDFNLAASTDNMPCC